MRSPRIRAFHHRDFDAERLADAKRHQRASVSVCIPARDEAATIGAVVGCVVEHLVERTGLVDEVLVVDDASTDATGEVAERAGARVVRTVEVLPEVGPGAGKGEALWKSVAAASGELIAWVDADITDFGPHFLTGLLGPLLTRPEISFVKGFYDRPLSDEGEGGGRVTELVARPAVAMLFPRLGAIVQPLSGEYAGRRSLLERLPFVQGYGVDLGLLVDAADREGTDAIVQVDLGTRRHRNRSLAELSPQALAVLQTALRRAGHRAAAGPAQLTRPGMPAVEVDERERPPLVEVAGYRRHTA